MTGVNLRQIIMKSEREGNMKIDKWKINNVLLKKENYKSSKTTRIYSK